METRSKSKLQRARASPYSSSTRDSNQASIKAATTPVIIVNVAPMEGHPEVTFRTVAFINPATGAIAVDEGALGALSGDLEYLDTLLKQALLHPEIVTQRRTHFLAKREELRSALFPNPAIENLKRSMRIANSHVEASRNNSVFGNNGALTPVAAWNGPNAGEYPEQFPANLRALIMLENPDVTALLNFYDIHLPANTLVVDKKIRLATVITHRQ